MTEPAGLRAGTTPFGIASIFTEYEGNERNENLRTFQGRKFNYGERGGKFDVEWRDGLFVRIQGQTYRAAMMTEAQIDNLFLDMLRRFNRQKRNASDKRGTSYAPALFAKEPDAKGVTNRQFEGAMSRLFEKDRIEKVNDGCKSRPENTLKPTERE